MTTQTEALKMALDALETSARNWPSNSVIEAITAIKEALAQPEQEPVAFDVWLQECESMTMAVQHGVKFLLMPEESAVRIGTAIQNTTPPQRKPLTDEQIEKLLDEVIADKKTKDQIGDFARAIEAAHGIK